MHSGEIVCSTGGFPKGDLKVIYSPPKPVLSLGEAVAQVLPKWEAAPVPALLFPPLVMRLDGAVEEAEMSRMAAVMSRLALWLEYMNGRQALLDNPKMKRELRARRKKTLAAYNALMNLTEDSLDRESIGAPKKEG